MRKGGQIEKDRPSLDFLGLEMKLSSNLACKSKSESETEIGNSLEFDFVVPPPHS